MADTGQDQEGGNGDRWKGKDTQEKAEIPCQIRPSWENNLAVFLVT